MQCNWCFSRAMCPPPRKDPPRFLAEGYKSITKSVLASVIVFIVFSCLGLLSFIELHFFRCRLVLFVSTLAKRLAGKTVLS